MKLFIWLIATIAACSITIGFKVHPFPAFFVGGCFGLIAWRICDLID